MKPNSGKEQWDRLRYFRADSTTDKFGMPFMMQPSLLYRLDRARDLAGVPFVITSGYRGKDLDSAHSTGHAVDIRAHDSATRYAIVQGAVRAGFNRIGVYDRHVHLDDDPSRPPNVMWTGESK